jgi:prephenate dehydratase
MKIAFQGANGAYSDMAARELYADAETVPCTSFDDAFDAVKGGMADLAVIPIDNTLAGRVADVHHLLPTSGLSIIGEHFLPIHHCLLGVKGSTLEDLKDVHSHIHAIPQCRKFIRDNSLNPVIHADTAGAAAEIATRGDKTQGAIASSLAAEIYDLDILARDIEDHHHNKTRFVVLSPMPSNQKGDSMMTAFFFEVRNIPAALFKAMGGFATNGVNMMKLESYVDHQFQAARFYCEVDGHPDDQSLKLAMEELSFFAKDVKILGSFLKSPLRETF